MSGQIWMSWPRVWEFHSPLCWLSHTRVVQIEWAWWKGSHSFFPLLMMIAIRNFWTRALANANSSSSFVFFWFQVKPVGWQLNYLISNCRAVLSSVLTVSKKNTHTLSLSLSLTTNQQTYPLNWVVGTNSILIPLPPFVTHAWMGQIWAPLPRISCKKYASLPETEGERERSNGANKLTRFSRSLAPPFLYLVYHHRHPRSHA
jgi:hypothetical protein